MGFASQSITNKENDRPPTFVDDSSEDAVELKKTFNKSRLLNQHRNILHEESPYREPNSWIHLSEKYRRKIFARYGSQSGVNPRISFQKKADVVTQAELEKVAEPLTLEQMIAISVQKHSEKQEQIRSREEDVAKKLDKLDQWKNELNAKVAKKEADALAAKERKERLIEEVRRHFGFKVDPRDDRFKEMLEQKEREDKKKQKEVKRKAKEEKMMAKLVEKTAKTKVE